MLSLPRSSSIPFIGKRVDLGNSFSSLIWKKLMIVLNGVSYVRF